MTILAATAAVAATVPAGPAEITLPGQAVALRSGGSATPYGIALPAGARCPGDTAHHGYHVFSYLVPVAVAPTTVHFTSIPDQGLGYFTRGVYVGALNTAQYTAQIVNLPTDLSWARLTPSRLFGPSAMSALWNGGIACVDARGTVASYWNTRILFRASRRDPSGFVWSVAGTDGVPAAGGSGLELAIALIVAALVLGAVALMLARRSARGRRADKGSHGAAVTGHAVAGTGR